jgi:membrane protein required for colicin V production
LNYIDYFIFAAAIIGFILGFKDGLVRKIIGLTGLIAAILLAYKFADDFGKILEPIFNQDEYFSNVIASILIFLVTILIASIIKRLVHPSDKINLFINQFAGGLIGIIQIIFFLSALLLILKIFSFPDKSTGNNSLLYKSVYNLIPLSVDLVMGQKEKGSEIIKSIIEDKDGISKSQNDSIK